MSSPFNRRALLGAAAAGAVLTTAPRARAEEPAKPTTPRPPVAAFAQTPVVDQIALSPNGKRCAIVTQTGDEKYLLTLTIGSEDAPKKIGLGTAKIRGLFWSDDTHVVLTTSVTKALPGFVGNKHEFTTARVLDPDTLKISILFDHEPGFYSMVMGDLGRIKTPKGYGITASNVRFDSSFNSMCLYAFEPDGGVGGDLLWLGPQEAEGWVTAPDGRVLAMSEFEEADKLWTLHFNTSKGKNINLVPVYKTRSALNSPDLIGIGRDGNSVVIRLNEGFENGRYHEIGADGKLSDPLDAAGEDKPRSALFHPVTGHLAGFLRHDDWFTYDYFDPFMQKLNGAIGQLMGADYRVSQKDFGDDPRQMIVYGESAGDAGTYYFSDFSNGTVITLASNYPDLPAEWISQKQSITYKAADGLDIHGYLTLPPFKMAKDLPLVVLPHGGPQVRDYVDFDWQVQALASRGYAVLQPNFRGSGGYGGHFATAGHGEWGGKMQTDLSDGVRWLAGKGTIDPKRVAIMGASYGGYAALAGVTLDPGVYNCAVAIAAPSDIKGFMDFQRQNSQDSQTSRLLYWRDQLGDKDHFDAISPARQAERANAPVLLIHGTDDTVVPIDQSQTMERALKAAGKTVEFITYKGQDHWETMASTRIAMMQAAVDFLGKYNPA